MHVLVHANSSEQSYFSKVNKAAGHEMDFCSLRYTSTRCILIAVSGVR